MNVKAIIPITKGTWESTAESEEWTPMYFMECLLDWSLFPGCQGKLYVETMENEEEGGKLRLGYQQVPAKWIHIEDSEILTEDKPPEQSARWALLESPWFDLPKDDGVSCLWILCKAKPGRRCSVALATLVIAQPEWDKPIIVPKGAIVHELGDDYQFLPLPKIIDPMAAHRSKEENQTIYAGRRFAQVKEDESKKKDEYVDDDSTRKTLKEEVTVEKKDKKKLTLQDEDIDPWRPVDF